jgi:hypothetical protein
MMRSRVTLAHIDAAAMTNSLPSPLITDVPAKDVTGGVRAGCYESLARGGMERVHEWGEDASAGGTCGRQQC